jgi:transcriptional regulator with XRE-family HTH domain
MLPEQCRGARGLLDWTQTRLAGASNLGESTIRDFEKGRRIPSRNNLIAIQAALEAAGVQFIPENGGGAGIRLSGPGRHDEGRRPEELNATNDD